ncbi:MAG TPA: DUF2461 family protein [Euzebya sp.]|nr:DUF2461 family protein [Euzebya sp.]
MDTTASPTFTGLEPDTLAFLQDLRDHADRDWFAANRARYLSAYDAPAKALVTALGERLPQLSPDLHADPSVGGSIFRVTRDTRFRPGTGPYKDYIDLWFWEGERALAPGGLYLRITPEVIRFGVGARAFSREARARYRRAAVDPDAGGALAELLAALADQGIVVAGERLRTIPRGIDPSALDPDGETARLLRHTALYVDVDEPAQAFVGSALANSALVGSSTLLDRAILHWQRAWPLHRWLVQHVQT